MFYQKGKFERRNGFAWFLSNSCYFTSNKYAHLKKAERYIELRNADYCWHGVKLLIKKQQYNEWNITFSCVLGYVNLNLKMLREERRGRFSLGRTEQQNQNRLINEPRIAISLGLAKSLNPRTVS